MPTTLYAEPVDMISYVIEKDFGLLWWLSGKEYACQCRRHGFEPGLGRSSGERNGNPLQYSCLANPMDRVALWATVHEVAKELDMTYWLNNSNKRSADVIKDLEMDYLSGSKVITKVFISGSQVVQREEGDAMLEAEGEEEIWRWSESEKNLKMLPWWRKGPWAQECRWKH